MNEQPAIQYAKTSDGVNIAFYTVGSGPPVIHLYPHVTSHPVLGWQVLFQRHFIQRLASQMTVIGLDWRGCGLSDTAIGSLNLELLFEDILAVLSRLDIERAHFCAWALAAPFALAFAARFPEKVLRLVLADVAIGDSELNRALLKVGQASPALEAQTRLAIVGGLLAPEEVAALDTLHCAAMHTPNARLSWEILLGADLTDILPVVPAPTLFVHSGDNALMPLATARSMAATMSAAKLQVIPGISPASLQRDPATAQTILAFLLDRAPASLSADPLAAPASQPLPEGAVVILFTDIVESTALTERLGDAAFRARARELDGALRTLVRESGGTPVEGTLLGDGLLAVFTSARQAIDCTLNCKAAAESAGFQLHLGLHAGDVLREGNNVYGGAVNIAARIMNLTAPGQVLVSDTVRSLARTSAGVTFADQGEHALKGIADPVRVFEVRRQG